VQAKLEEDAKAKKEDERKALENLNKGEQDDKPPETAKVSASLTTTIKGNDLQVNDTSFLYGT